MDKVEGVAVSVKQVIAGRIRAERERQGWTQEGFAERIGLRRPRYLTYESGRSDVPPEVLVRIAEELHKPVEWFYGVSAPAGEVSARTLGVAVVPRVRIMNGNLAVDGYDVLAPPPESPGVYSFRVADTGMAPRIEPGDLVFFTVGRSWLPGEIVAARVRDQLVVRRVFPGRGRVRLEPEAEGHLSQDVSADDVLGPVLVIQKQPSPGRGAILK